MKKVILAKTQVEAMRQTLLDAIDWQLSIIDAHKGPTLGNQRRSARALIKKYKIIRGKIDCLPGDKPISLQEYLQGAEMKPVTG